MPFPLFALPEELRHRVFQCFKLDALFDLSLSSSHSSMLIEQWTSKALPFQFDINLVSDVYELTAWSDNGSDCKWHLHQSRHISRNFEINDQPRRMMLDGKVHRFIRSVENDSVIWRRYRNRREGTLVRLAEHLIKVFHMKFSSFFIVIDHIEFLEKLLPATWLWRPKFIYLEPGSLAPDHMSQIIKTIGCHPLHVSIACNPGAGYDFGETINCQRLTVEFFQVTRRQLLDFRCVRIVLIAQELDDVDCNAFIRQWLDGDDLQLEAFGVTCRCERRLDRERILEGIRWYDGCAKNYDPVEPNPMDIPELGMRYADGVDIVRNDGKLATVLITDFSHVGFVELRFVVWHTSDPDHVDGYFAFYTLFQ